MLGYCLCFIKAQSWFCWLWKSKKAIFGLVLFLLLFFPFISYANGVLEECGGQAGMCDAGLVCVKIDENWRECRGNIGYLATSADQCSPELIWVDGKCQLDLGQAQTEKLGLGEASRDIRDNIRTALNIVLGFLGVVAVIMIIYGGFLWMTSAGREEQVIKAKKTILWTGVGILIITTAWTITSYLLGLFGGESSRSLVGRGSGRTGVTPGFGTGGVVEAFKIEQIETSRIKPEENLPHQELYTCSAVQTNLNHFLDKDIAQGVINNPDQLLIKEVGEDQEINFTIFGSWSIQGRRLIFEHPGQDNSFAIETEYKVYYPRELKDQNNYPLADCKAENCTVPPDQEADIVWQFKTSNQTDKQGPQILLNNTYPKPFKESDPAYPTRGVSQRPIIAIAFSEPILASSVLTTTESGVQILKENIKLAKINNQENININQIVEQNQEASNQDITLIPNANLKADLQTTGSSTRLVFQLLDNVQVLNLEANAWYQLKISGVKDLCGLEIEPVYWHFQVSGAQPRLSETPADGLTDVCFENIEIGIVSNISGYDVLTNTCQIAETRGGFITSGILKETKAGTTIAGRTLQVLDDLPLDPEQRANVNFNNYCRQYFFLPQTTPLSQNVNYTATVSSRFYNEDSEKVNKTWSFVTAQNAETCVRPPILVRADPATGPKGQCVSIYGRYLDYFNDKKRTDQNNKKESLDLFNQNQEISLNNYLDEDLENRWSNSSLVIKLPKENEANWENFLTDKTYQIKETITDQEITFFSTPLDFLLTDGNAGPCLDYISPDTSFRQQTIELHGSEFGEFDQEFCQINYQDGVDAQLEAVDWEANQITSTIPSLASAGLVRVQNKQGLSNSKFLSLPELQKVEVFRRDNCSPYFSPNPQPNAEDVCLLKDNQDNPYLPVFIEFNKDVTGDNSAFLDQINYGLIEGTTFKCNQAQMDAGLFQCNSKNQADYTILNPKLWRFKAEDDSQKKHTALEFNLQLSNPADIYNKNFTLVIFSIRDDFGINTPADFSQYNWQFTTMNSEQVENGACNKINKVELALDQTELYAEKSPNLARAQAQAQNMQCQSLPHINFAWSASQPIIRGNIVENGDLIIDFPNTNNAFLPVSAVNTNYLKAQAVLQAEALINQGAVLADGASAQDQRNITVYNSAYCRTNQDCKKGCVFNSSDSVSCDTSTNRCKPYIRDVSPNKASQNDWVSIHGCYFGSQLGKVVLSQQNQPSVLGNFSGFPTICQKKLWQDKQIIFAVPSSNNLIYNNKATAVLVNIGENAYQSNLYNSNYNDKKFALTQTKNNGPLICAVENITALEDDPCYKSNCGKINDSIQFYGKNIDQIQTENSNGLAEFSKDNDFVKSEELKRSILLPVESMLDNSQSAESIVAQNLNNGLNYTRLANQDQSLTSNSLQFNVGVFAGPKIEEYGPLENTVLPCDSQNSKASYCTNKLASSQAVVLKLNKEVDKPDANPFIISYRDDSSQNYQVYQSNEILWNKIGQYLVVQPKDKFNLGIQYQIKIDPNQVKDSQGKVLNCGALGLDCAWEFVLEKNIHHLRLDPAPGEDGIIYLRSAGGKTQDLQEFFVVRAFADPEEQEEVTDFVIAKDFGGKWIFDNKLEANVLADAKTSEFSLKGLDPKTSNFSDFVGEYKIQVTLQQIAADAILTVKDPASLEIIDYLPKSPSDVCSNTAISLTFNHQIEESEFDIKLFNETNGSFDNLVYSFPNNDVLLSTELEPDSKYSLIVYVDDYSTTDVVEGPRYQFNDQTIGLGPNSCPEDFNYVDDKLFCKYTFEIRKEGICALDYISVIDSKTKKNEIFLYNSNFYGILAQAYTKHDEEIFPTSEYQWKFGLWDYQPKQQVIELKEGLDSCLGSNFNNNGGDCSNQIKPVGDQDDNIKSGEAVIDISATFTKVPKLLLNHPQEGEKIKTRPLAVYIRPCQGGGDMWWEFKDQENSTNLPPLLDDQKGNFSFGYCRESNNNFLPTLQNTAVSVSKNTSREVLKEYFLRFNESSDFFLLRIFPAKDYFISQNLSDPSSALKDWYRQIECLGEVGFCQSYSSGQMIDVYPSLKTKTAVYVQALNISDLANTPKAYSNVYVLAVNKEASTQTKEIFQQLVDNWLFNINLEPEDRFDIKNDYQRIQHLASIGNALYAKAGNYPILDDAMASGISTSIWPIKWRLDQGTKTTNLGKALGLVLPLDPLDIYPRDISNAGQEIKNCLKLTNEAGNQNYSDIYNCLWQSSTLDLPQKCFSSFESFKNSNLGYGTDSDQSAVDWSEIFTCWDDENLVHYCQGENPHVYYYQAPNKNDFALYGNLEYNDKEIWCRAWQSPEACFSWDGSGGNFCNWSSGTCVLKSIEVQPGCAGEGNKPFNLIFKP